MPSVCPAIAPFPPALLYVEWTVFEEEAHEQIPAVAFLVIRREDVKQNKIIARDIIASRAGLSFVVAISQIALPCPVMADQHKSMTRKQSTRT